MILQALAEFYETLAKQGKVPRDGWANTPVGSEICLNPDGTIHQIVSIRNAQEKGKPRPQEMQLPSWGSAVGSGIRANFMFGSAAYVLGMSGRDSAKQDRLEQSVEKAWKLHHEILDGISNPVVEAVLRYFDRLKNGERITADQISSLSPDALTGDNFVFSLNKQRLNDVPEAQQAWDTYYQLQGDSTEMVQCLVTGELGPLAEKHPFIKGLRGAQGSGAGLSSYNADSFKTYGFEQNQNAPVSRHSAYAYTQALTYLLANPKYCRNFGDDLTIVWWPENAVEEYGELMLGSLFGAAETPSWTDNDISEMLASLSKGRPVRNIEPDKKFYVLGLSPNASRIIVRFILCNTFGAIMKNVMAHYDRLNLAGSKDERMLTAARAFRAMVREDVNKELPEPVIQRYFESVLFGRRYPTQMFAFTHRRIQVETSMYWQRISLIKAYFLQILPDSDKRKECFTVSLLTDNTNPGYVLGRLFAVYEAAQSVGRGGNPWDEAPIHPMFAAAMSTPATIYPRLARIVSVYLPKEDCHRYAKYVEEIKTLLPGAYPKRLDLVDQGAFDLGYYHQRHYMFGKKANDSAVKSAESEE